MVAPTAQLVALACHYNGRIRGLPVSPFLTANSSAQFCEYIQFVRPRRGWLRRSTEWAVGAHTPDEWMIQEGKRKRMAILTHHAADISEISDRLLAGFVGGGGQWQLGLVEDGRMDVWSAKWEVGNREAPDKRIWRVSYGVVAENVEALPAHPEPIDSLVSDFNLALSEIQAFCMGHGLAHFAACFRKADECLHANDPFALVYHKDLTPEGLLSLPAKQLLAACQAAWVFGGMGSWNDMGFDGAEQARYEKVSNDLYALVNRAICGATNGLL